MRAEKQSRENTRFKQEFSQTQKQAYLDNLKKTVSAER